MRSQSRDAKTESYSVSIPKVFHTKKLDQTIDLLAIHEQLPQRYPYLLESIANGDNNCRYSILFAFPQADIKLTSLKHLETENVDLLADEFIDGLNEWFEREKMPEYPHDEQTLPFYGGWFIYLGYELAEEIEPVLKLPKTSEIDLPIAMATRIPAAIIVDKINANSWLVAEPAFEHLIDQMIGDINANTNRTRVTTSIKKHQLIEESSEKYISAVKKIQNYIVEGDVFQVNISRPWKIELETPCDPAQVYRQLCKSNPAPFAGLMTIDNVAVISSSPERLICVKKSKVSTRPIAGTRPRQRTESGQLDQKGDEALSNELISHPKERAEHVMLIDLERNDLGRICQPGSIKVDELMILESYEHVHHIVSNISGEITPNILPGDVIRAVFPGGTITGCPKVRCMQIISEFETTARQAYTGSMGYLCLNGDMDLNILIRTIIHEGNQLHIRAGAGIVAYSDPEKELQETRIKAKGMLNAVDD